MSLPHTLMRRLTKCFPRVSGDEPEIEELRSQVAEFSPRERG